MKESHDTIYKSLIGQAHVVRRKAIHNAALVERRLSWVVLVKMRGKDSDKVVEFLVHQVQYLRRRRMASLVRYWGTEDGFREFNIAIDVSV